MDNKVLLQEIGERIRQVRKTKGLTQKEFAQRIGISNTHLSDLEAGKSSAGAEFLVELEKTYIVDIHWLITGKRTMFEYAINPTPSINVEQHKKKLGMMQNLLQTMQYLVSEELDRLESASQIALIMLCSKQDAFEHYYHSIRSGNGFFPVIK